MKITTIMAIMLMVGTLTAVCAILPSDNSEAATTDSLTYTVTDGVLTISGTGDMMDYTGTSNLGTLYTFTSCVVEDGVTSIGAYAFYKSAIKSIIIPDSVTSIKMYALSWANIESISIPDSVTSIELFAFDHCLNLTSLTIPNGITSIGINTFGSCGKLTSITIPNSVTSIKNSAFLGCSSLISIIIPDSVTSIEKFAFQYDANLTTVYASETVYALYTAWPDGCSRADLTVTYVIDGETVHTDAYSYGGAVTAYEYAPATGHTFSGWDSTVVSTMPAECLTYTGTTTAIDYTITYTVDGETIHTDTYNYGDSVTAYEYTPATGHTFSGWDTAVPATMPATDLTFTGTTSAESAPSDEEHTAIGYAALAVGILILIGALVTRRFGIAAFGLLITVIGAIVTASLFGWW